MSALLILAAVGSFSLVSAGEQDQHIAPAVLQVVKEIPPVGDAPALENHGAVQAPGAGGLSDAPKLAPYVPTPAAIVEQMLRLAGLKPGENMVDLGSGDGRIVILGAKMFHAYATGIEIDPELVRTSVQRIQKLGLQKIAKIVRGDILRQNYHFADVVTVYLYPEANEKIRPLLEAQLKKGARVVAHDFEFPGWKPDKIETIEDDGTGRSHTLYLYNR